MRSHSLMTTWHREDVAKRNNKSWDALNNENAPPKKAKEKR